MLSSSSATPSIVLSARIQRWNQIQPTETDIQAAATLCANPIHDGLQSLSKTIDATLKLPFADEDSDLTIVAYLHDTRINTGHTVTDAHHRAANYLSRFHNLYQRVLGRLAVEVQPTLDRCAPQDSAVPGIA